MTMRSDTVRAVVLDAPNADPRVVELSPPTLTPGSALLSTRFSEVCGTDVHIWRGKMPGVPFPMIPGHVSVGVLGAFSRQLFDIEGKPFKEGDLVTFLDVHETCNHCFQCLVAKQTTRCPHRKVYGITYGVNDGPLGGWASHIWMKPGVKLLRIPDGMDPSKFIAGGCGLVTALHAVERGAIKLGASVAVLGVGPVGQAAIALAALSGAHPVIAVGAPQPRLDFALRMGATHTVSLDMPPAERAEAVRAANGGRGVDVVIEAAGDPRAVADALEMVRDGGVVVVAGQYTDAGDLTLNPHRHINRKHVEIRGCWGCDYSHFYRALQVLAHQGASLPWIDAVSARYALDDANAALAAVANRDVIKALIVPN